MNERKIIELVLNLLRANVLVPSNQLNDAMMILTIQYKGLLVFLSF